MPRQLIRIPFPRDRLVGAHAIEPTYPKEYTPEQMREWADDLDRLNRTAPEELEGWRRMPPEQLTLEQRRVLTAHATYYGDSEARIKGSLRDDGTVELDNGLHRVAYMQERGVESIPVWVSAADQRRLDQFTAQCERDLARQPVREAAPDRVAQPDREAPPEERVGEDAPPRPDRER
jgi:hypothetical protein